MKKLFNPQKLWLGIICLSFFASCTKENHSSGLLKNEAPASRVAAIDAISDVGAISGQLSPAPRRGKVEATDGNNISMGVIVNADGTFLINRLPAGTYTLNIGYVLPSGQSGTIFINNVTVVADATTNLGVIPI